jgi:hypothetical protein
MKPTAIVTRASPRRSRCSVEPHQSHTPGAPPYAARRAGAQRGAGCGAEAPRAPRAGRHLKLGRETRADAAAPLAERGTREDEHRAAPQQHVDVVVRPREHRRQHGVAAQRATPPPPFSPPPRRFLARGRGARAGRGRSTVLEGGCEGHDAVAAEVHKRHYLPADARLRAGLRRAQPRLGAHGQVHHRADLHAPPRSAGRGRARVAGL